MKTVRLASAVTAVVWHPDSSGIAFVGTIAGSLYVITTHNENVSVGKFLTDPSSRTESQPVVEHWLDFHEAIYALGVKGDGRELAVVHGQNISLCQLLTSAGAENRSSRAKPCADRECRDEDRLGEPGSREPVASQGVIRIWNCDDGLSHYRDSLRDWLSCRFGRHHWHGESVSEQHPPPSPIPIDRRVLRVTGGIARETKRQRVIK
jgi:hypothetical protein